MKIRKHHRGIALSFIAVSTLYYFGMTSQKSSAVMLDCGSAMSITVPVQECQGLVELFNNTNGASWTTGTNWNLNINVCTWFGVSCAFLDGQWHVTRLSLPNNNLSGSGLPANMSGLRYITGFNLTTNPIRGTLPSEWSTWTGIQSFAISPAYSNLLSGTLPSSWSTWTKIKYFRIGYGNIRGNLPSSWSTWTGIQYFEAAQNELTGALPSSWSTWTGIQHFAVSDNDLIGTLPASWSGWINMSGFNATSNQITGTLPSSWSTWTKIKSFGIDGNQLSGPLPTSWSTWANIKWFGVGNNQLTGTLPSSWSTWSGINVFEAGNNQLTGTLPSSWSTWRNLTYFSVQTNKLRGTFPASYSAWNSFDGLITVFRNNFFEGDIPASWIGMTGLSATLLNNNCLNPVQPNPPSTFINSKAESGWTGTQTHCGTDLVITKSNGASTGLIGGTFTYTIHYINSGENAVTGAGIIDYLYLSTGVMFVDSTPAITSETDGMYYWDIGTLEPMQSGDIVITVSFSGDYFSSGDTVTNYAAIGGWYTYDPNELNNETTTSPVTLFAPGSTASDLVINKTNGADTGTVGEPISYIISYINSGDVTITGTNIADSLPGGFTFTSAFPAPTTITGSELYWDIGTLTAMQSGIIIITGYANETLGSGDMLVNMAVINGNLNDYDNNNNISFTSPIILFGPTIYSDLTITKSNNVSTGTIGGQISYTINYRNSGAQTVSGITITDSLPSGLSFVSAFPAPTMATGGDLFWSIGALSAMQTGKIIITGYIENTLVSGDTIINTAIIDGLVSDTSTGNNTSTTPPVTVVDPTIYSDLTITKSNNASTGTVGSYFSYTINYRNSGATMITGISIVDSLPAGLTFISAAPVPTIATGGNLFWSIGTLNAMQTGKIIVTGYLENSLSSGDTIINTATIDGFLTDTATGNNSSTTPPVTIFENIAYGDINIQKIANQVTGTAGNIISYLIKYANVSGALSPLSSITISDLIPAGLTYISTDFSASVADFSTGITATGSNVTWNIWNVTGSTIWTGAFTIYTQIGAGVASGTILTNRASIVSSDIIDLSTGDNTGIASGVLVFGPLVTGNMSIFKITANPIAIAGDIVSYMLTYQNDGESTETGMSLIDIMDDGLTFLATNFTTGLTITPIVTGGTMLHWNITGSILPHTSGSILVSAMINTGVASGTIIANRIAITGTRTDTNPTYDSAVALINVMGAPEDISGGSYSTTGASTGTNPTPSNNGGGGYAGGGFGNNPTPNIVTLGSAPTLLDDEVCPYKDGDFEKYKMTFKDIQSSVFKSAVDLMLDYCLVQGEYNGGKMFGVYNYLTWGEAYKVFARLAGLSFSRTANPAHWSDKYRFAGRKINLWASTTSQPHNPRSYIRYADIYTIGNNILKYYKKPLLEYDPNMNYNNAISRGKFALFMQHIIQTVKQ